MDSIVTAQDYLAKYGIKPSVQRIAIMEYLMEHRTHPSTDEIHSVLIKWMPTLSKTTVYNTLKLFTEQGALTALGIDDRNIRYDIDVSDHAHFICLGCGKVYDIPVDHLDKLIVRGGEELTITETHLYYKGYCKLCDNKRLK
ncbi:Fur family transcriptional regulator [Culturomica massiliensis]|jgi:Fe2+ or Zn2+ uptake regulation protein|uniref:Fur family transcriptional regulator n=1 Tax=Culturomica massiliensis TaxID=1841857 RepID=UPI000E55B623|nr:MULTISPECIES: Fur family transcriptional regulator [Odoribacteraceae]RHV90567.1 transcriptional repressor [Odoribacter sp. OF09-27XD]